MGFFWDEGREPSWSKVSNYDKGQQRTLRNTSNSQNQLARGGYQDAIGLLQDYLNPNSDVYSNFEKPYIQQFEQQTLPGIAERFAGGNAMGGGLMTSGFGQSLGAAGANLQAQLAQMKQQYQRQSINDLLQQYNQLTNQSLGARPYENVYDPGTQGQLGFGGKILESIGTGAATAFGGPLGGMAAKGASNLFQSMGNQTQSQPFSAGTPGGYQGSFGNLPNYGGY
jgi:hypothetical protein